MNNKIQNEIYQEERALYNLQNTEVIDCIFAGAMDGESVLKEVRNVKVESCKFSLRYPLWHAQKFQLIKSDMDEKTRAPIWYAKDGEIKECNIEGIKGLRECSNIQIEEGTIKSKEFGWKCKNIQIFESTINSEYFLFESKDIEIEELQMKGKYSFQYIENMQIKNSFLDTKDAFWHSKNVTVSDSFIKGEYLGWFSENLTLINCKIIGTQPFCYCKGLELVNCTMEDTDLAFEYSEVNASIIGNILSVKNPKSGVIMADNIEKIIQEDSIIGDKAQIIIRR